MQTMRTKTIAALAVALAPWIVAPRLTAQEAEAAPEQLRFGFVDGSDVIAIEVDSDDVRVLLNGEEAPADRYHREGSRVRCLDGEGRAVAVLDLGKGAGTLHTLPRMPHRLRLGVTTMPVSDALAAQLGLEGAKAVQIEQVAEDSPGGKAGLLQYDVITEIDGQAMHESLLREVLAEKKPKDTVELRVLRRGKATKVEVTLEAEKNDGLFAQDYFYGGAQSLPFLYAYDANLPQWQDSAQWLSDVPWRQHDNAAAYSLWNLTQRQATEKSGESGGGTGQSPDAWRANRSAYQTLLQLAQPGVASKGGKSEGEGASPELADQLRTLEKRLESLEKLLGGIDKKLK